MRCSSMGLTFTPPPRRLGSTSTTSCCGWSSCAAASFLRAFYYTALLENEEYSPIRPLVDWLHYNGFTMRTKPAKEYTDSQGRRKVKGNMDIELCVDAMELAARVDHVVLFSGDGDFRPLVESLQRQGFASRSCRPSAASRR